jgi:hypothetical protein
MTDPLFGRTKWKYTELERDFQQRVTEVLNLHGWRVYSIPDSRRASVKGFPDICAWNPKRDELMFIELKAEKGRLSPAQKTVLDELKRIAPTYVFKPSQWDEFLQVARGK